MNEVFMWVGGQLIVAAAIWGAIRADIRNIHILVAQALKRADEAHSRIDRMLESREHETDRMR